MNTSPNRRTSRRAPARSSLTVVCRAGALDLGPNLAVAVLDLSDTGARLRLRGPLRVGQTVFLTLQAATNGFTIKRPANVAWVGLPKPDGTTDVGVAFEKSVRYNELFHLARL